MTNWYEETVRRYNPRELKPSEACVEMVKHFEGFVPVAEPDPVGIITYGYGETHGVREGDVITEQQASEQLQRRITEDYGYDVQRLVKAPLTQYEFDALSSWTYNLGPTNLASSTLLKKLNQGLYEEVPEQIMRWNTAAGKTFRGLTRRRAAESLMFQGRDWKDYKEISG